MLNIQGILRKTTLKDVFATLGIGKPYKWNGAAFSLGTTCMKYFGLLFIYFVYCVIKMDCNFVVCAIYILMFIKEWK